MQKETSGHFCFYFLDSDSDSCGSGRRGFKNRQLISVCRAIMLIASTIIAVSLMVGCGVTRSTTTVRSAVEAALVSKAVRDAVGSITIPKVADLNTTALSTSRKSFYIQPISITASNQVSTVISTEDIRKPVAADDAHNMLLRRLLEKGYTLAPSAKAAHYHIYMTLHFAEVDDNQYTFGIPSIPIPVANVGTVSTPELALLGLHSQFGRAKISVLIVENSKGTYVGYYESPVNQSFYNRWKLLLFFGWRSTNLPTPF